MAKGPEAFRSISEASGELGVPQHVLRFWETKFTFVKPMKRAGGRRFYRPQDIAVLAGVRRLLHDQRFAHAAFIAETPVDAPGDEARNVSVLRALAAG